MTYIICYTLIHYGVNSSQHSRSHVKDHTSSNYSNYNRRDSVDTKSMLIN